MKPVEVMYMYPTVKSASRIWQLAPHFNYTSGNLVPSWQWRQLWLLILLFFFFLFMQFLFICLAVDNVLKIDQ